MAKKFGGFTEPQREVLARKMGFKGPMDQFGTFLQSSPANTQKFQAYEQKAQQVVAGTTQPKPAPSTPQPNVPPTAVTPQQKPAPAFAYGGTVTSTSISEGANGLNTNALSNPTALITPTEVTPLTTSADQFINANNSQAVASPDVTAATVAPTATAADVTATAAPQVTTETTAQDVQTATDGFQAAQGTVSANSQVTAATALPSANATVQGQLTNLMAQFEGGETPAWASGAIRNANAIMSARGLGSSSMAGGAVTTAAMESAISIAAQDASTYSAFEMQNLNNLQQARLTNAQSFLQMDLANLDAKSQMTMFKSQSIIQSLFTDTAAKNASAQFNATSQGQTDQFFANLKTQVSQFNASQQNAMEQFKAGQTDSVNMFNRQMNDATEQFNASNRLVVDQSNAEWRRAVTTANNASINEANRIDAQAATGMTLAAYNNIMQTERDLYSFAFQSSENAAQRASAVALAQIAAKSANNAAMGEAVGALGGALVSGIFEKW